MITFTAEPDSEKLFAEPVPQLSYAEFYESLKSPVIKICQGCIVELKVFKQLEPANVFGAYALEVSICRLESELVNCFCWVFGDTRDELNRKLHKELETHFKDRALELLLYYPKEKARTLEIEKKYHEKKQRVAKKVK